MAAPGQILVGLLLLGLLLPAMVETWLGATGTSLALAGDGGGKSASPEDRTEAPTQRRLDRARDEGQSPIPQEAVGFATLLAWTLAGSLALPPLGAEWLWLTRALLEMPQEGAVLAPAMLQQSALVLLPYWRWWPCLRCWRAWRK